jgi:hypothetical protein
LVDGFWNEKRAENPHCSVRLFGEIWLPEQKKCA